MVNVLIPTKPDDLHAIYVKLALEKKGHAAVLWYTGDYPSQQTHSFELKKNNIDWRSSVEQLQNIQFDVVWLRRPVKPVLPESLHPEDYENAKKENSMFYQTIWHVIAPQAIWINPFNTISSINSKMLQLKVAATAGLNVPDTMISNDPTEIKKYISKYGQGNIVYKTLYPMVWLFNNEVRLTYTNTISLDDLPKDRALQSTPGIFQQKINKSYELRITYFGDHYIAIKIDSQIHPKGIMDWRYVPTHELVLEKITLPDKIDQSCRKLMQYFGVIFGCFDFIVTPDNEYYFLEINEQGQFLWIEEVNSEIKMLDAFTNFLIDQVDKESIKNKFIVSMRDFDGYVDELKNLAIESHVNIAY